MNSGDVILHPRYFVRIKTMNGKDETPEIPEEIYILFHIDPSVSRNDASDHIFSVIGESLNQDCFYLIHESSSEYGGEITYAFIPPVILADTGFKDFMEGIKNIITSLKEYDPHFVR